MTVSPTFITDRLAHLEAVIERGLATFMEVGSALLEIRDSGLFRGHGTFEAYCRWRFPTMSYLHARRLMDAAEVVASMPIGIAPTKESVARELVPVMRQDPVSLPAVMAEAVERSEGQPITAATVRAVVRDRFRSMAAESEAEIQAATAHWTDDQRAAVAPERMRQRGELMRLTEDLAKLPDPVAYAREHRDLSTRAIDHAEAAHAWLSDFLSEWRHQ